MYFFLFVFCLALLEPIDELIYSEQWCNDKVKGCEYAYDQDPETYAYFKLGGTYDKYVEIDSKSKTGEHFWHITRETGEVQKIQIPNDYDNYFQQQGFILLKICRGPVSGHLAYSFYNGSYWQLLLLHVDEGRLYEERFVW